MKVLITGAWGIVGRETVPEFLEAGYEVCAFDMAGKRQMATARRVIRKLSPPVRQKLHVIWGSLTDIADVSRAVTGVDAVIHLGAIIPPLADHQPERAAMVNVGGTEVLVRILERINSACKLIFTSSIAIWGDRRARPLILPTDQPSPESRDVYARQKLEAESVVRACNLPWSILRLTYIVSPDKLAMDPLLFEMPLDTPIEICHARDVALALRHAVERMAAGQTFLIAGGAACRTTFAAYLHRMLELFGFGRRTSLPAEAWSTSAFHCAWMDTTASQGHLEYQRCDLDKYYAEVGRVSRFKRFLVALVRPIAWRWLLGKSPHWRQRSGRRGQGVAAAVPG